jgi:Ca-activated chloride channel family protein
MSFLAPSRLLLLAAVAALAIGYVALQVRRRHYAVRFTNLDLLASVAPRRPGWRRHAAAAAVGLALIAFVVSLARPVRAEQVARKRALLVLVLDTSTSMEAADVAPSRIAAAVENAKAFVDGLPDDAEVGLVTFNVDTNVVAAPTTDHDLITAALGRVQTRPGTAGGDAIYAALDAIEAARADSGASAKQGTATIVMLSDGATDVGSPVDDAADAATAAGVTINTISFGTQDGTITQNGQTIDVPANPDALRTVAETTGGSFFEAASADELHAVYQDIDQDIGYKTEQREILRFFVGLGFVALLVAAAAAMVWNARFL